MAKYLVSAGLAEQIYDKRWGRKRQHAIESGAMNQQWLPPELDFFNSDLPTLQARAKDEGEAWGDGMFHLIKLLATKTPISSEERKAAMEHVMRLAQAFYVLSQFYMNWSYWIGYLDAKRHYDESHKKQRTPLDRTEATKIVESMYRQNPGVSTKDVLKKLDEANVSGFFGGEKYFGPRGGKRITKPDENWVDALDEQAVIQWIYRSRKRVRKELEAMAWLKRSETVLGIARRPSKSQLAGLQDKVQEAIAIGERIKAQRLRDERGEHELGTSTNH
jgi:hypothetical protein